LLNRGTQRRTKIKRSSKGAERMHKTIRRCTRTDDTQDHSGEQSVGTTRGVLPPHTQGVSRLGVSFLAWSLTARTEEGRVKHDNHENQKTRTKAKARDQEERDDVGTRTKQRRRQSRSGRPETRTTGETRRTTAQTERRRPVEHQREREQTHQ